MHNIFAGSSRTRGLWLFAFGTIALHAFAATESVWTFDLNSRARVETRERTYTFNRNVPSVTDDSWWLTRVRLGAKGTFSSAWSSAVQLQDAREVGSQRSDVPFISGSEGVDPLDVRQAYVEYKDATMVARVGRQLLSLGEERLVGVSDWSNAARSFDAARLTLPKVGQGLDLFVSSVVQTQPGSWRGRTGWQANHSSRSDLFGGIYSRFTPQPGLQVEPYVFARHSTHDVVYNAGPAGSSRPFDIPQKIRTLGLRLVGSPRETLHRFDYDAELAGQGGHARGRQLVGSAYQYPGPDWLKHRAWAVHGGVGYTTQVATLPVRLYAEVNRASGDRNPADRHTQSFLNLFPANHRPYGTMDVFAWKNMREAALHAIVDVAGWKARLEQHWFDLDNVNDTWFRSNGSTAVRPLTAAARQASRNAGNETDLSITRSLGKHVTLELGGSYFAAGTYLTRTGGATDARMGYLQTTAQW